MKAMQFFLVLFLCLTPTLVFGGTAYYVDCNAPSDGDGSYTKPWNNLSSVNTHDFSTGADVYLKVNTTCIASEELKIDWTGTSHDPVIIGAYYGEKQFGLNGNDRPTIEGAAWTVPSNENYGLVEIYGDKYNYITVRDLHVKHSKGTGIRANYSNNIIVDNCYVYRPRKSGIALMRSTDSQISNNTVEESSYLTRPAAGILASAMSDIGSTTRVVIRNNTVFHAYEGIGLYKGVNNSIVEYNVVYDCRSYMLYIENSAYIKVRYNLVYSSIEWNNWHEHPHPPAAIIIDSEQGRCNDSPNTFPYIGHSEIYGNLIANANVGINLSDQCDGSAQVDNKIYNNTIVDCNSSFRFGENSGWLRNEIKNNISWTISANSNHVYNNDYSREGVIWSHNNFDDPISGNAANNARIHDPKLSKTTEWRSIEPGTAIGTEWSLRESSLNEDSGISIDGYNGRIYDVNFRADPIVVDIRVDNDPSIGAWTGSPDDLFSLNPPGDLKIIY